MDGGPDSGGPAPISRIGRVASALGRVAAALAAGVAGAVAARQIGLPLPFLLGPLLVCAAATVMGLPLQPAPWGRETGQVVVGLAIGLRLVPTVLYGMVPLLPAMAISTAGIILVTMAAALVQRALGGVDRKTAFFATAAAGLAEMAVVARERGGDGEAVSVVHVVRVTTVVTAVPLLVTALGHDGGLMPPPMPAPGETADLLVLLALALAVSVMVRPLRLPNSWLLASAAVGAIAAAGFSDMVVVPRPLLMGAQILIGVWLGCRFRRELLLRLPRVTLAAAGTTVLLIVAALGGAILLSAATGLPFATSLLSVAPAGVTEMVLTATVMHLDAATVTAFHLMRIAVVVSTILLTFRLFELVSRWVDGSRV